MGLEPVGQQFIRIATALLSRAITDPEAANLLKPDPGPEALTADLITAARAETSGDRDGSRASTFDAANAPQKTRSTT